MNHFAHERKSKAKADACLWAAAVCLTESIEHMREKVRSDPLASVCELDLDVAVPSGQGNDNSPGARRELDRVHEQVPKHLLQPVGIREERHRIRRSHEIDCDPFHVSLWPNGIEGGRLNF